MSQNDTVSVDVANILQPRNMIRHAIYTVGLESLISNVGSIGRDVGDSA